MFHFPDFNPIAFHVGPLKVHWYGIMYLIGFISAWLLANYRAKHHPSWRGKWNNDLISDLIFYAALGVILGGRIGYMLFYDLPNFLYHPFILFHVWDGGMSFHGGLIGVIVAMLIFAKRKKFPFLNVLDFIAPLVPIGLAAGRLGNFINGELWGRITTMPWGIIYPKAGPLPRQPSELYEFCLEGVVLFIILWCFSKKPRPTFATSALFLLCYGCFRFFCEFWRQPDPQLGFIAWGWLTMGQLLSFPMIVLGIIFLVKIYRKRERTACNNT